MGVLLTVSEMLCRKAPPDIEGIESKGIRRPSADGVRS